MSDQPDWLKNHVPAPPVHRWKPGQSGNPAGRPKGTKNHRTELAQAFHDEGAAIAQVVIDASLKGDLRACELVLARLAPPLRARAEKVVFDIPEEGSLTDAARAVLLAIARGELDPVTGQTLINAISAFAGIEAVDALRARLDALESREAAESESGAIGGVLALPPDQLAALQGSRT